MTPAMPASFTFCIMPFSSSSPPFAAFAGLALALLPPNEKENGFFFSSIFITTADGDATEAKAGVLRTTAPEGTLKPATAGSAMVRVMAVRIMVEASSGGGRARGNAGQVRVDSSENSLGPMEGHGSFSYRIRKDSAALQVVATPGGDLALSDQPGCQGSEESCDPEKCGSRGWERA